MSTANAKFSLDRRRCGHRSLKLNKLSLTCFEWQRYLSWLKKSSVIFYRMQKCERWFISHTQNTWLFDGCLFSASVVSGKVTRQVLTFFFFEKSFGTTLLAEWTIRAGVLRETLRLCFLQIFNGIGTGFWNFPYNCFRKLAVGLLAFDRKRWRFNWILVNSVNHLFERWAVLTWRVASCAPDFGTVSFEVKMKQIVVAFDCV